MKYKSDILETIHESATEKYKIGVISEERMREYDEMCLAPEPQHETIDAERHDLVTA
jgi:putative transcriptional regulator